MELELMAESGRMGFVYEGTHKLNKMRENASAGAELSYMPQLGFGKGKKSPAFLEAWNLSIPVAAKHPEEAWKFIEHWASPDIQLYQAQTVGTLPMRKSLGDHASFKTSASAHIRPALDYLLTNPLKFDWPENTDALNDALRHAVVNVLMNKQSPKVALIEAEKNYNRVVKK
jgi:ABC-type glycerol-3-phosphate transport system substrate-binding protein